MDNLLGPLEELEREQLTPQVLEQKFAIPSPEYLKKTHSLLRSGGVVEKKLTKYDKEYEAFCRWSALPKGERNPKTAVEWERQNMLPKSYSNYFKSREDFRDKTLTYFWEWMMDVLPEVVYAVYKRSINKSPKDAALFIDLISKRMNLDKPKSAIQPMILVGVPQDKIDALFTPKGYENVKELVPEGQVK